MSLPLRITIWVLCILALVYFLWFLYGLVSIRGFAERMKRKLKASAILFASKRDLLLSLLALCKKSGIDLPENENEKATKARWTKFEIRKAEDVELISKELSDFEKQLMRSASSKEAVYNSPEFTALKEPLDDVNANYRRLVATYDSDLVGYDYWRKSPLFRVLFFLLGFRKKKRLV
jgi:hypothetical protein